MGFFCKKMKTKLLLYSIGSCTILSHVHGQVNKQDDEKPNVLFIIMDDMCDWANFMGFNQAITPNLDKLADRAMNFMNGYTAVPLSNPSRATMLSGIQPYVSGIYDNNNDIKDFPVVNNSIFMPQHFRNNGYKTIAAGKVFHSKPTATVMNNMCDDKSSIDGGYGPSVKNSTLPSNLQTIAARDFEPWTGPDTDFPDVNNSQKIINVLGQSHDKPFFIAMGFYRPHNPWTAPVRYFDMYDINKIQRPYTVADDLDDIPSYAIQNFIGNKSREEFRFMSQNGNENGNWWDQYIRAYLACVTFADDRLGKIIDALDTSAYADNTWIVLVGDNGFHIGEKERWAKSALWRKTNHVPFLVVPPKNNTNIQPGVCEKPVSLIDIYPTLTELCGLPPVNNPLADGTSFVPLLENPNAEWNIPCISTFRPGNFVVHYNQWNYIKYKDGSHELYNTKEDEAEIFNLADKPEYKHIVDSLAKYLPTTWYGDKNDIVVESISEDFSSTTWDTELNLYNPDYINIDKASPFVFSGVNVNTTYMDKFHFGGKGAIQGLATQPSPREGIEHDNGKGVAVAFRFRNTGESYFELPTLSSAGTIDLHVRNNNATGSTSLELQRFDDEWTTIHTFQVSRHDLYSTTYLNEVLSYDINSSDPVRLRISRGANSTVFVNMFRIDVSSYASTALTNIHYRALFKQAGRRLMFQEPVTISLYNVLGTLVFSKKTENEIEIPQHIGKGFFIVESSGRVQKIFLI